MSGGATARLFVAVEPSPEARERLVEWARVVAAAHPDGHRQRAEHGRAGGSSRGGLRLLDAQSLHVTLCFLGSRPVAEIDALSGALADCVEHACELDVGAPLWLPARRPRTLAVEVHDRSGGLTRVRERVSETLAGASAWRPERRRFRPHITVARVRGGSARRAPRARPRGEPALPATPPVSFTPPEIVLFRSWLAPEGARYEALASSDLAPVER